MEFRVLKYFAEVARVGSISKAARNLHISQPSLSRQLMDFEKGLGKQLLVRDNRGITLTEEGEMLRRRADEIITLVARTQTELKEHNDNISGEIHIGGSETQAMRMVVKAACDLRRSYPSVYYHFYTGNSDDVLERLDKGLLDFGIMIDDLQRKKYNSIKLRTKELWGVLMRKDCELAAKEAVRPEDLWDLPLILTSQSMTMEAQFDWLGKQPEELNVVGTFNLIYNASMMVEEGMGYAICLDKMMYGSESSSLCFRPLEPRREISMSLVWKKDKLLSKAQEKFIDELKIKCGA